MIAKALSIAEAKRFLAAAKGDELEALYVLAITTGMRQGELLALTWDDIDFTTGKLQARRSLNRSSQKQSGGITSELKTVFSRRCIQLTPIALDALQRHGLQQKHLQEETKRENGEGHWVFCNPNGKPLHVSNLIRRSFRPLLEKASIPPTYSFS
ncbi:hypothetical protein KDW_31460 [Dictyobacter vulcani]|uniref:Tyr recombinase domain-containing protein n=1 Tax=Dictyobacter vulcani TaxID=2607529 RepID=A0A5J4KHN6_9CHLR|nr:tyrosine-type recombinase/integrase [Dictyobacter vulcani]GER88984.1 hypothetical protein KDW_31460 [Dictyobacter vulcani]